MNDKPINDRQLSRDAELRRIKNAMRNAKASLEVEGFEVNSEGSELVRKRLSNEITEEEFLKRAKDLAKSD